STFEDTLLWYFPSGSPVISNNVQQSVIYNTPGSYQAILYVVGGGCSLFDSAFVNITVNAAPNIAVSGSPSTTICSGGTVNLSASGGVSYAWSPPTGLSATTGANVTATPPNTITYNVQGTGANGCTNDVTINIDVSNPPAASMTVSDSTACEFQPVVFDGSNSTSANSFSWSFPGGTPATSNASAPTVSYPTAGTYTATLIVSNSCGADTITFANMGVGCVGINDPLAANSISALYNANETALNIAFARMSSGEKYTIRVMDATGRMIAQEQLVINGSEANTRISMTGVSAGIYTVQVVGGETNYTNKFMVR
ncbi:MAG: Thermitase, partial [Bacteroidetes bacterium]